MVSSVAQMIDPGALAIVLAGTLLATIARCGWSDIRRATIALFQLRTQFFDADANRTSLAKTLRTIEQKGPLCADVPLPPDPGLAKAIAAFLQAGSLDALHSLRRSQRAAREAERSSAVRVYEYAGELAPVFGLVGTLVAITQLVPQAGETATETTLAAIATAVLSTLYGVLTAHLICIPIGRAIERKGEREDFEREELFEWLDLHLRGLRSVSAARLRDVA